MSSRCRRALIVGTVGVSLAFSSLNDAAIAQETASDIDGNVYPVVAIDGQVWLATNLRVTRTPSGERITSFFFNDDSLSYARQGRLYTWDVAMNGSVEPGAQGICPDGWHLPTDEEWTRLFDFVGESGGELLVGGSTGFDASLDGGADFRGNYLYSGELALLWSSTEVNEERALHHSVASDGEVGKFAAMKGARIYVRCIAS